MDLSDDQLEAVMDAIYELDDLLCDEDAILDMLIDSGFDGDTAEWLYETAMESR